MMLEGAGGLLVSKLVSLHKNEDSFVPATILGIDAFFYTLYK